MSAISKRQGSDSSVLHQDTHSKRKRLSVGADGDLSSPLDFEIPDDTKAALFYLKSILPLSKFEGRIPAVILKHQIYCVVKDKTLVDRQLNSLWENNEVRMLKLTSGSDEFAVVFTEDYVNHIKAKVTESTVLLTIDKFVSSVLPFHADVSISRKDTIDKSKLTEKEITHLVNIGVLTTRDVGSWWLSIPGAGIFMKNFSNGRKALVRMIRQRKYQEILEKDLLSRNFDCHSKLGMLYHIYDIVGAEIVKSVETTSGRLLRLDVQSDSRARSKR